MNMFLQNTVEFLMNCVYTQVIVFTTILSVIACYFIHQHPWFIYAYVIAGIIPAIEFYLLNKIKKGRLVKNEIRKQQNKHFSHHIAFISYYNIFETATQGLIHIYFGMWIEQIKPNIWPDNPFSFATWFRVAWQVLFMLLCADVANYFFHRYSHENRWLYRYMHQLHHQYRQVEHSVYSLFYVHPVEMILSNICFFSGIFIFETDLFTCFLFGSISSILVAAGHSGIELDGLSNLLLDPKFHQLHHEKFNCNYAEHTYIMDRMFGTYREH